MMTYRQIEIALGLPARSSYWIERNAIRKLWRIKAGRGAPLKPAQRTPAGALGSVRLDCDGEGGGFG
jgi:hypothetical protein